MIKIYVNIVSTEQNILDTMFRNLKVYAVSDLSIYLAT